MTKIQIITAGSPASPLKGSPTFLPLPTGVAATDTANLNTVLAHGGRIRPNPLAPTAMYSLTAPLVLASGGNTDVDFGGCTFVLTGQFNLLQNSQVAADNTATDATTTVGSSVVASPTLAPIAAAALAAGNPVSLAVVGAGYTAPAGVGTGPTWLYGRVLSVAGNNITLTGNVNGVAATFALSGATAYLWTSRDANIDIAGGTWDAQGIWTISADRYAAANNSSFLRFRRVDGLTVKGAALRQQTFSTSGALGWCFGVDPADCTDVLVAEIEGQNASTCVNATGPLARVTVRDIWGQTQDDMVAFGCTGAAGNDTEGDVTDLLIDGVRGNNSWCAADLYAGKGNYNAVRYLDATVRGVKGTTITHCVKVQDYPAGSAGQINARVDDVTARALGSVALGISGQQAIWNPSANGKVSTVPFGTFEPSDIGLLLASCDPYDCVGSSSSSPNPSGYPAPAGYVILALMKVPRQVTVANLVLSIQVPGSGLTAGQNWAGIYDGRTLALIASTTVDQTTNWQSVGVKTMALTPQSGQSLTIQGGPGRWVWAAFLCNGTTPPIWLSKMPLSSANLAFAADIKRAGFNNVHSLTTLPATIGPVGDQDLVFAGAT
jgi:hypothetical protein